jgi:hypothetical protein
MKKIKIGIITALLLMFSVNAVNSQEMERRQMKKFHMEEFLPDLTDEQKEALKQLHVKHMADMQEMRLDVQEKKVQLEKLEIADEPKMVDIDAKIDELFELKKKMAKQKSAHRQEVRKAANQRTT